MLYLAMTDITKNGQATDRIEHSKLFGKVIRRIKAMGGIKLFLLSSVTALHLAVAAGCVGTD